MTSVVALIDCRLGIEMAKWLDSRGELAGVVVHPDQNRNQISDQEIEGLSAWNAVWPDGLDQARALQPDYLLSVQFGYRIPREWLDVARLWPLNVHPGYLPDNRGRAPSAWPILNGSKAGVTLHVMNEGLDEGPWIIREEAPVYLDDTGDSLADRVEAVAFSMLKREWPTLGSRALNEQSDEGTYHSLQEILGVVLSPSEWITIDKLRARMYHGHGMVAERDGHRYEVRVEIERVDG